jgi:hypothetical protein
VIHSARQDRQLPVAAVCLCVHLCTDLAAVNRYAVASLTHGDCLREGTQLPVPGG